MSFNLDQTHFRKLLKKLDAPTQDRVVSGVLDRGGLMLAGWTKEFRLSGPRPKYLGVVTGRLRASIVTSGTFKRGDAWVNRIGTNVEYGPKHEFGDGVRKRPFLKPSLENKANQEAIVNDLLSSINFAIEAA